MGTISLAIEMTGQLVLVSGASAEDAPALEPLAAAGARLKFIGDEIPAWVKARVQADPDAWDYWEEPYSRALLTPKPVLVVLCSPHRRLQLDAHKRGILCVALKSDAVEPGEARLLV